MRNLLLLLRQLRNFLLFLVLEITCLVIVFRNNHIQQSSYINSSRAIAGHLYAQKEKLTGFLDLREINDSLMHENARLRKELGLPVSLNPLKDTSYALKVTRDSLTQTLHYQYIPAKVINNTIDQSINYLTLNKGYEDGIRRNMAVISSTGIVGRISHVSPHYSVALSFLSNRMTVSAMVADGTVGKLSWDGKNPDLGILSGIPPSVKLQAHDSVYTSGFGNFPEKLLIGRVMQHLSPSSYKIFLTAHFRNLHFVYVINEEMDAERKKLEETSTSK